MLMEHAEEVNFRLDHFRQNANEIAAIRRYQCVRGLGSGEKHVESFTCPHPPGAPDRTQKLGRSVRLLRQRDWARSISKLPPWVSRAALRGRCSKACTRAPGCR